MIKFAATTTLFFSFLLIVELGFVFGSMASILVSMGIWLIYCRLSHIFIINDYSKKYEHIHVLSRNKVTGEELTLPDDIIDLVIWVDYNNVMKEVEKQKALLLESKNPFYCDSNLTDDQKIKVDSIIFQDGEFINENWRKEFKKRIILEVREKRAERHLMLKSVDPVWYHKFSNDQNGVIWEKR